MPEVERPAPRVLIVDPAEETRSVLCELLTRTGIQADAAACPAAACESLGQAAYRAVVIDVDALSQHETLLLGDRAARGGVQVVAVGTNRPVASQAEPAFVRKPYHYRELVHKIWASLGVVGTQAKAVA